MSQQQTPHEHPGGDQPHRHNPDDELATHGSAGTTGTTGRSVEGEQTLELREEELTARKQSVQAGEVEIRKNVVEEQRTLEVPVTREEVTIERHAVDRRPADAPIGEGSREVIEVPVTEERVSAEKRAVVTEELEVGKRAVQETQQVSGTVRREVADIDTEGDVTTDRDRRDR